MSEPGSQHILLVEDNPADIYLIQRAIADCSPRTWVWLVTNGSQAPAFLRQEPPFVKAPTPALILLELILPGRDGRDILVEVRAMAAYQTTPVVIVSGRMRAEEEQHCLQLGANAYVQKSTDFATYFGSIQTMMRDWLGADCSPS
jgi:CheY-like chemotaxis protein